MEQWRTKVSIIGMAVGIVVVTAIGLIAGFGLFPSIALSLIGLFLGGWLAEQYYTGEESTRSDRGGKTA